jgi:AraC-like DNA-binding protein
VLNTRVNTIALGRATVGAIRFESDVRILTEEAANFHVDIPLSGKAVSRIGTAEEIVTKPGSAQVFMPGERADLRWSANTQQLCVMVQKTALERHLSTLLGAELSGPIAFRTTMDLRSPGGGTWMHALRLVDHELRRDDGLLGHALMRRTLERLLIESLLIGQEHNYTGRLQRVPADYGTGAIRTAIELLETHPERPWTAGVLAAEVGLSVRALHAGFHSKTELGPMTYLRHTRLARVHEELLEAEPATTTVSSVARRWGFAHLGRFSAAYAKRYGQSPSSTMRSTGVLL